jgi:hypothetical protein
MRSPKGGRVRSGCPCLLGLALVRWSPICSKRNLEWNLGEAAVPRRGSVDNAPARYWSISPMLDRSLISHTACETVRFYFPSSSSSRRSVSTVHVGQPHPRKSLSPVRMAASRTIASATVGQSRGSRGTRRRAVDSRAAHIDQAAYSLVQSLALCGREDFSCYEDLQPPR